MQFDKIKHTTSDREYAQKYKEISARRKSVQYYFSSVFKCFFFFFDDDSPSSVLMATLAAFSAFFASFRALRSASVSTPSYIKFEQSALPMLHSKRKVSSYHCINRPTVPGS